MHGQVGVDMSRFREFPYRGSLLRLQSGAVQEVTDPLHQLTTYFPASLSSNLSQAVCRSSCRSQVPNLAMLLRFISLMTGVPRANERQGAGGAHGAGAPHC